MTSQKPDDAILIQYLLGEAISEADLDRLEIRYFQDDRYFDHLLAVEDDLIDSYVLNALPPRQRTLFETNFLASPRRREKYEAQQQLVKFFRSNVSRAPFLSGIRRLFRSQTVGVRFAMATVAGLAMVWMGLSGMALFRAKRDASSLRAQIAELESRSAPRVPIASFLLNPGILRSGGGERIQLSQGADAAVLKLRVINPPVETSVYEAELSTAESLLLWRQSRLHGRRDGSEETVEVLVPAGLLMPGDYVMALGAIGVKGKTDLPSYVFRVDRN